MKTELSYFGTWKESSLIGTKRHLILIIPTTISVFILNTIIFPNSSLKYRLISAFFIATWLASALGVQNSTVLSSSAVYGGLVFFVIYSCILGTIYIEKDISVRTIILILLFSFVLGALNSTLIYYTGPTFKYLK